MDDPSILVFVLVSFVIGFLCGLLPYLVGSVYGMRRHAKAGMILCIVGGLLGGIVVALPVALIFTGVILFKTRS
ncbi:hypothetical protein Dthio_PD3054 [Desulfonatronospira thiodismutans ASO3-1]|uniref:Uncharacterized protein n=1 Tax=Desulfonatronospira thiodismutans ASO3-1 TaxID=555779 RepID=D6SLR4_9BACT|nr:MULTISPECIES: hypothetical protein [Desulfonatronospira]EFI35625.1 hypothetical protein Dthio_PD3054 [Desulfonatronospira thiodismutans ASO3-1]RQD78489.1 MAG: hypothetical protein D5S03_02340 [Desulfonatronospira sp. MSAO_Bac3]